jgi:hypothetical protein
VAEIAGKLKEAYFHGVDVPLDAASVNIRKGEILQNILFRITGIIEAQKMGLDKSADYQREIIELERKTLFDTFMQKVIKPEVRLTEEDVRSYYDEHIQEYQTPAMFKVKSLPFNREEDALNAVEKLKSGSDFKWVSANVKGLAHVKDDDLLQFDNNILSNSSLPTKLQGLTSGIKIGDTLIYPGEDNIYYVLLFENVFPPEDKPYESVRAGILKIVFQKKVEAVLDEWVDKLKDVYKTRVYISYKDL